MGDLPASLKFFISNFQNFVTLKLDSGNYLAWRVQVETTLSANSLLGLLLRENESETGEQSDDIEDHSESEKNLFDKLLLSCLMATLTPALLPHVTGSTRVRELWRKLEERFNLSLKNHVMDLKRKLFSIRKTDTMERYLNQIREIIQKLAWLKKISSFIC